MTVFSKEQMAEAMKKRMDALEERLNRGWEMVDGLPEDHPHMTHFLSLLRDYEKCCFEYKTLGGELRR